MLERELRGITLVRDRYIDNIELETALDRYMDKLNLEKKREIIGVERAHNRITDNPVYARVSSPFYNASAMDGIMLHHSVTSGASEINPVILEEGRDFVYVNTGNPIREPFNTVIMIEDVTEMDSGKISIIKAAFPWQHIRPIGEDIVKKEMIIPSNHRIRAVDLGALLSGGITELSVYKNISVGILPTGSEIINIREELDTGKIIDSNSFMFEGLIMESHAKPNRYTPVKDEFETLKRAIIRGVEENDILIINAGSSTGTKDFTASLIRELGEVVIHGIAIKPGKPTILGMINNKPVIGIPGYPVSAYISFMNFVKPIIEELCGDKRSKSLELDVSLGKRVVSSFKHKEKVRVNIGYINGRYIAVPLTRGAGSTMSLVRADGIITIPKNCEGYDVGEICKAELLKPLSAIEETLLSIGSHDIVMDLISDSIALTSSHVGSMGGVMALRRGECHLSPIHLLDEESGVYNIPTVKRYFPNREMVIIKGVRRAQGFIVKPGNPLGINHFSDLCSGVNYINRQAGSGTRLLLDYRLKKESISSDVISGYQRVVPTHMAVAIAVKSGSADVGLGVKSAAAVMGMDFIEVGFEDYDFVTTKENLETEMVQKLIQLLQSKDFKTEVDKIGGYCTESSGEVIYVK